MRKTEICERSDLWGCRGESPRSPVQSPFFFEIYRKEKRRRHYKKALAFYLSECRMQSVFRLWNVECGICDYRKSKNQRRHSQGRRKPTEESPVWQVSRIFKIHEKQICRFYSLKRQGILRSLPLPQNDGVCSWILEFVVFTRSNFRGFFASPRSSKNDGVNSGFFLILIKSVNLSNLKQIRIYQN